MTPTEIAALIRAVEAGGTITIQCGAGPAQVVDVDDLHTASGVAVMLERAAKNLEQLATPCDVPERHAGVKLRAQHLSPPLTLRVV